MTHPRLVDENVEAGDGGAPLIAALLAVVGQLREFTGA
jgi:hypothetical protein